MVRPFITVEKIAQDVLDFYETVFPDFSLLSKSTMLNHITN